MSIIGTENIYELCSALTNSRRRYMAEILLRRKTLSNQAI